MMVAATIFSFGEIVPATVRQIPAFLRVISATEVQANSGTAPGQGRSSLLWASCSLSAVKGRRAPPVAQRSAAGRSPRDCVPVARRFRLDSRRASKLTYDGGERTARTRP